MQCLCRHLCLDIVYLLLRAKPVKFNLEQSAAKLFKLKSLCIVESLRQDVFEPSKLRNKDNLYI